jgi:hypothetical protein
LPSTLPSGPGDYIPALLNNAMLYLKLFRFICLRRCLQFLFFRTDIFELCCCFCATSNPGRSGKAGRKKRATLKKKSSGGGDDE